MKKASIALVFILAVVIVTGFACDDIPSCEVCGRYTSSDNSELWLQVDSDNTFYTYTGDSGTWKVEDSTLFLRYEGVPDIDREMIRLEIQGNTLMGTNTLYKKR